MIQLFKPLPMPANGQPQQDITDEGVMSLIQNRDNQGLALLHGRYSKLLKCMGMNVLHNDADAEDLIQDVFVEIWNRAGSYDPSKGRPLAWIATLTRRRAIDRLRKRETYCSAGERFALEVSTKSDSWTHVHEDVVQGERNDHLGRALGKLPVAQRDVIKLTFYGQMSQREISNNTGIPLGTIKTRLELGLRKMAAMLFGFEDLMWDDKSLNRPSLA